MALSSATRMAWFSAQQQVKDTSPVASAIARQRSPAVAPNFSSTQHHASRSLTAKPFLYAPDEVPPTACRAWQSPWPSSVAVPAEARAPWFEKAVYQQQLDNISHSEALSGNRVRILVDGQASFAQKEKAIREADVIFLKIYSFEDDASGQCIARQIEQAAERGCQVFVQYGVKSLSWLSSLALIKLGLRDPTLPVLQSLSKYKNVHLVPNDRPSSWIRLNLDRDHEKYLITWRAGADVNLIMGGMNISDSWKYGGQPSVQTPNRVQYRDTDVEIVGPTADAAIDAFIADMGAFNPEAMDPIMKAFRTINSTYRGIHYPPMGENAVVRFVRNKPQKGPHGQYIRDLYIALLETVPAGETVRIANAYFLPRGALGRAIVAAAERGVSLEIVVNSCHSQELEARYVARATHSLFRKMLRRCAKPENLRFYEFFGSHQTGHNAMHQKVASFGNQGPYIIGSSNLDELSLHINREAIALIYDAPGRKVFDQMWERDVNNGWMDENGEVVATARQLTAEFLQKESPLRRFKQKALYRLCAHFM